MIALALLLALVPAQADELLDIRSPRPLQAESALEALEPWETPVSGFFIRSHHGIPEIDESRWMLEIDGLVEKPLRLSLADLKRLKTKTLHAVLQCSGNGRGRQDPRVPGVQWLKGAVGNAEWTGVAVADLLALAAPKPGARFARVEGADKPALASVPGFIRSVPLEKLKLDALLAWDMNRRSMPAEHGGPLRLIVPGWYGQNWMKWVTRITLSAQEDPGYYQRKAYRMPRSPVAPGEAWDSSTGEPIQELRVESILVNPKPGETLAADEVELRGKAFSGSSPVAKVDISTDDGKSWSAAVLEPRRATGGWQAFHLTLALSTGPVTALSRATDAAGRSQPLAADWNPGGYLYNAVDRVSFSVGQDWVASGAAVARSRCQTCHAPEMLESQRLTLTQWESVVKKMETFGAHLGAGERDALLSYLAKLSPDIAPERPKRASYASLAASFDAAPAGDHERGRRLFAKNCASCHGASAEGDTAPRLAGRAVSAADFRSAVLEGRGEMPGFEALSASDLADLRSYLRRL